MRTSTAVSTWRGLPQEACGTPLPQRARRSRRTGCVRGGAGGGLCRRIVVPRLCAHPDRALGERAHPVAVGVQVLVAPSHVAVGLVVAQQFCGEQVVGVEERGEAAADGIVGQDGISVGSVSAAVGVCGTGDEEEVEGEDGGLYGGIWT